MSKRALYREYRPVIFSDVIGQDHIITILKNQVKEQAFSHAYLFCGSRGTGKTSSAKILSRAVNCLHPIEGDPCGKCEACMISKEENADIIEIDAASHTGVDNVRELIEQAQFAPLQLKYRVFIIDEVHMLSSPAFNALLKTLEEPPKHVIFILATTEPQKLPATIISRCQRFDFHRLTIPHIVYRLKTVLESVGTTIDPDGLRLIARAADGGMRDALSLVDQCLSFGKNHITKEDVIDILGNIDQETLFFLSKAIFKGDAAACLSVINEVIRSGRDISVFTNDLLAHLRNLLIAKTCGECKELLDITEDQMDLLLKQIKNVSETSILHALETVIQAQSTMKLNASPRIVVESALVRACRPVDIHTIDALEIRIKQLEDRKELLTNEIPSHNMFLSDEKHVSFMTEEQKIITDSVSTIKEKENKGQSDSLPDHSVTDIKDSPAVNEAENLWKKVLERIKEQNPMVFYLAKDSIGASIKDDHVNVVFPANQESKIEMCNAQVNYKIIQDCVNKEAPGMRAVFQNQEMNAKEKRLQELFGSTLTIEIPKV